MNPAVPVTSIGTNGSRLGPATELGRARDQPLALHQTRQDLLGRLLGRELGGVDADLGALRRLVGAVDAGEVLQLPGPGLPVEALHVAPLGLGQRSVDE